jgi:hypothetical protein
MMEELRSAETSVLTYVTLRNIPEDAIVPYMSGWNQWRIVAKKRGNYFVTETLISVEAIYSVLETNKFSQILVYRKTHCEESCQRICLPNPSAAGVFVVLDVDI